MNFPPKIVEAAQRQVAVIALTSPDMNLKLRACELILKCALENSKRALVQPPGANVNIMIADAENRARTLLSVAPQNNMVPQSTTDSED